MTAGFDATSYGADHVRVVYDDELMRFHANITVADAQELIRNLRRAIKDAEAVE